MEICILRGAVIENHAKMSIISLSEARFGILTLLKAYSVQLGIRIPQYVPTYVRADATLLEPAWAHFKNLPCCRLESCQNFEFWTGDTTGES